MDDNILDALVIRYREQKRQDRVYQQVIPRLWDSLCSSIEDTISELNVKLNSIDDFTYQDDADSFTVGCKTGQVLIGHRDDSTRTVWFEFRIPRYQSRIQSVPPSLHHQLVVRGDNVVFQGNPNAPSLDDVVTRVLQFFIE